MNTIPPYLAGAWINELGSRMYISNTSSEGEFIGFYTSGVGPADYWYPLAGKYDTVVTTGHGLTMDGQLKLPNSSMCLYNVGQFNGMIGHTVIYTPTQLGQASITCSLMVKTPS